MSGPQVSSDSLLARARKLTELPGMNELSNEELLALVECAEAIQQWRVSKSSTDENDAYTNATRALSKLEGM